MRVNRVVATASFLLTAGSAFGLAVSHAEPSAPEKEAEAAIRRTLNGSGRAIDACSERYLTAQPGVRGQVRVDVKVRADGWAVDATTQTGLPQARTLRLCLEAVARGWRFPKPRSATTMGVTIPIVPGVKFRVPDPDEKKPERAKAEDKPKGFIQLQPGSFLPNFRGPSSD